MLTRRTKDIFATCSAEALDGLCAYMRNKYQRAGGGIEEIHKRYNPVKHSFYVMFRVVRPCK